MGEPEAARSLSAAGVGGWEKEFPLQSPVRGALSSLHVVRSSSCVLARGSLCTSERARDNRSVFRARSARSRTVSKTGAVSAACVVTSDILMRRFATIKMIQEIDYSMREL